jgi:hypothetical protein
MKIMEELNDYGISNKLSDKVIENLVFHPLDCYLEHERQKKPYNTCSLTSFNEKRLILDGLIMSVVKIRVIIIETGFVLHWLMIKHQFYYIADTTLLR